MTTPIAQGPVDVNVSRHCTCHPDDNPPKPCEHRYAFRDCEDAAEERYLRETLAKWGAGAVKGDGAEDFTEFTEQPPPSVRPLTPFRAGETRLGRLPNT